MTVTVHSSSSAEVPTAASGTVPGLSTGRVEAQLCEGGKDRTELVKDVDSIVCPTKERRPVALSMKTLTSGTRPLVY